MSNYSRGADFEHTVIRTLEAEGWLCIRSAGSHKSADVVALRKGQSAIVQCKLKRLPDPAERAQMVADAAIGGAQAVTVRRGKKRGTLDWKIWGGPLLQDAATWMFGPVRVMGRKRKPRQAGKA